MNISCFLSIFSQRNDTPFQGSFLIVTDAVLSEGLECVAAGLPASYSLDSVSFIRMPSNTPHVSQRQYEWLLFANTLMDPPSKSVIIR
jgi:hypothetical protein